MVSEIEFQNEAVDNPSTYEGINLIDVTIFHLDKDSNLIEKIYSEKADISNNQWVLEEVIIFKPSNTGVLEIRKLKNYTISWKVSLDSGS